MDYNGVVQQCGRQRTRDYVCILVLGNHWRKRAYRWTALASQIRFVTLSVRYYNKAYDTSESFLRKSLAHETFRCVI